MGRNTYVTAMEKQRENKYPSLTPLRPFMGVYSSFDMQILRYTTKTPSDLLVVIPPEDEGHHARDDGTGDEVSRHGIHLIPYFIQKCREGRWGRIDSS